MAGRRRSVGPINYHELPRKRLQALCKKYGFPANKTNVAMADALTVLLNAPERLAMGIIDSPAVSSKSSYNLSSWEVEESPMISPGVDSLPCISESRQEVFEGLRITRLPEIMEIDTCPEEEVWVMKAEETSSTHDSEEMHSSDVADMMTDSSATAGNSPLDSNVKGMEIIESNRRMNSDSAMSSKVDEEMDCRKIVSNVDDSSRGNDMAQRGRDFSCISDGVATRAGLSSFDEGSKQGEFSGNSPAVRGETSRGQGFVSDREAKNMECEDRLQATLGIENVDELESTSNLSMDGLVYVSDVMRKAPLLDLEETSDCRLLDEVTEVVEARRKTSESKPSGSTAEEFQDDRVTRDSTTDRVKDQFQLLSTGDHVAEAINCPVIFCGSSYAGENTPIPLSVMPHCSALDISVSNKQGVRLVVDLNDRGFPTVDLFETEGDIKISSHITEGMKSGSGSQGLLSSEETDVLKTEFIEDEFFDKEGVRLVVDLNRSFRTDSHMLETDGGDTKSSSDVNEGKKIRADSQGFPNQETEVSKTVGNSNVMDNTGVKLIVDLMSNRHYLHVDTFETEEDIKIRSDMNEGTRSQAETSSQELPCPERLAWKQDEAYGFKSLNPAALSPKVKRSLGIDIPKLPISRLTFPQSPKFQASSGNKSDVQFRFPLLISPVASPVAVAPPGVTALEVVLDTERNSSETTSTSQTETAYVSNVDSSKIMQQLISVEEEKLQRSESTSPGEGYVKEIVNLLESKSGEKESAREASRKDCYKPSPLVRSRRIERASKFGRLKRAAVLAGKRSLWPPTNTSGSVQEEELDIMDIEPLQSIISSGSSMERPQSVINSRSLTEDETADSIEPVEIIINSRSLTDDETADSIEPVVSIISSGTSVEPLQSIISSDSFTGDETAGSTEPRRHAEQSLLGNVASVSMDTPGLPQPDANARDIQSEYSVAPTGIENPIVGGMFENSSIPDERVKEKSTASPLGLRDSNTDTEAVFLSRKSSPDSSKLPVTVSIHKMLRENCASTTGKENERIKRHQEKYKTPLSGKWEAKALRAAEMNAISLREKIIKRRRGIEEDSPEEDKLPNDRTTSLSGRLL